LDFHGFKNKDLKKQTRKTKAFKSSRIADPPGNSPLGAADWSFYSTNKARMQAVFGWCLDLGIISR
jgi:hypothetical protein